MLLRKEVFRQLHLLAGWLKPFIFRHLGNELIASKLA
jgi:hypothetical protein